MKIQRAYKVAWYGGEILEVERFFPSSKLCRKCGVVKDALTLADRVFICGCGHVENRDLNAAINQESVGLNTLSSRGIQACGESVRPSDAIKEAVSMKQEENIKNLIC